MKLILILIAGAMAASLMMTCEKLRTVEHTDRGITERYTVDRDNRRHGIYQKWLHGDTLFETAHYMHGKLHQERTIYFKSGIPEIVEHYVDDTIHGPYKVFYETGALRAEGNYERGVMRGIWRQYYPDGGILEEVAFEDNLENGPFVEYYDNGNIKARGTYLEGDQEHDTLWLYNDLGILETIMLCDRGICNTIWKADE